MFLIFTARKNNIILTFMKDKLNKTDNDNCCRSLRKKPMVFRVMCLFNVIICKGAESAAQYRSKTYKSNDSHKYAIILGKQGVQLTGLTAIIRVGGDVMGRVVVDRTHLQNC